MAEFSKNANSICRRLMGDKSGSGAPVITKDANMNLIYRMPSNRIWAYTQFDRR